MFVFLITHVLQIALVVRLFSPLLFPLRLKITINKSLMGLIKKSVSQISNNTSLSFFIAPHQLRPAVREQFTDHERGLPDPKSFPPMWQSWLRLSPVWTCTLHSDLACLYCTARVSVGRHKNVRYFLSIIPWLRLLDRCLVQMGYCGIKDKY